ncbi:MAG: putative rane protein [Deltaproteobacteria bacterium]|nr:putative rane protein [Deltaproteobacteria bacterium]
MEGGNTLGSWVLRILLFVICGIGGYTLAREISSSPPTPLLGLTGGLFLAALTLLIEKGLKHIPLRNLLGGFIGLILGIMVANLVSNVFFSSLYNYQQIILPLFSILYGVCGYIGLRIGSKKGGEIHVPGWKLFSKNVPQSEKSKILDTSVIIDGRIADITETGFVEGTLIIPQFVLNELYPAIKEVDSKLIELAKGVHGKIVTNDSNLNKVAELQGIQVLNINELANSIKPVVLPGEEINVKILKEGKETGQGVAYLDDGTMIVVDNGRRHMGKTIDVVVTSVLQTPAGRMIFARLKEEANREHKGKDYYYPLDSEF